MADRAAPSNPEAERLVLGAVLVEPSAIFTASVEPDDFPDGPHRAIWRALLKLSAANAPIDLLSVQGALGEDLARVGGVSALSALVDGVPRVTNVDRWAEEIRETAKLRRLAMLTENMAAAARGRKYSSGEFVERAFSELLRIAGSAGGAGIRKNPELVKAALANIEQRAANPDGIVGYRTGLAELDEILQGIRPGRMGLIGARLGQGKSILALQIGAAIAQQERAGGSEAGVLLNSLEMDGVEVMERQLARESGVDLSRLHGAPPEVQQRLTEQLMRAYLGLESSSLLIVEDAWTVEQLRAYCMQVRAERGLAAVIVDYAQLQVASGRRPQRRFEEVGQISVALRRMAKELNVVLIVVAQLNREAERSTGRGAAARKSAPTMEHIAEGDQLGRDCHWAILIDRDPQPLQGEDAHTTRGQADLRVAKNRGGRTGKVRVRFDGGTARFAAIELPPWQ